MIKTIKYINKINNYIIFILVGLIIATSLYLFEDYQEDTKITHQTQTQTNKIEEELGIDETAADKVIENIKKTVIVSKGDNFLTILKREGVKGGDIAKLLTLAKKHKLRKILKPSQKIIFEYSINLVELDNELTREEYILSNISIVLSIKKTMRFYRDSNGQFTVTYDTANFKKYLVKYETKIKRNLISSLKNFGIDAKEIINLVNAYSKDIDFQRAIKKDDSIKLIIEKYVTEDEKISYYGKILFSSINTSKKQYNLYYYKEKNNIGRLVNDQGINAKKTLLKTPVKVVRISGTYGYRKKHPVLGYGRMHKGVDFAGPTGTPIYAAGDGVVEFIGWGTGYGRLITIRHNKKLSTAYAHASKFANNLKKGSEVKQGQIIAYIGKTGLATGPHLHYEVRINNKPVNPMKYNGTFVNTHIPKKSMTDFVKNKNQLIAIDKILKNKEEKQYDIIINQLSSNAKNNIKK